MTRDHHNNLIGSSVSVPIVDVSPQGKLLPGYTITFTLPQPDYHQTQFVRKNPKFILSVDECELIGERERTRTVAADPNSVKEIPTEFAISLPVDMAKGRYSISQRFTLHGNGTNELSILATTDDYVLEVGEDSGPTIKTVKINSVTPRTATLEDFQSGKARFSLSGENLHHMEKLKAQNHPDILFTITNATETEANVRVSLAPTLKLGDRFSLYTVDKNQRARYFDNVTITVKAENLEPFVDLVCTSVVPNGAAAGENITIYTLGLDPDAMPYYEAARKRGILEVTTASAKLMPVDAAGAGYDIDGEIEYDVTSGFKQITVRLPAAMSEDLQEAQGFEVHLDIVCEMGTGLTQEISLKSPEFDVRKAGSGEADEIVIDAIVPYRLGDLQFPDGFDPNDNTILQNITFQIRGENLNKIKEINYDGYSAQCKISQHSSGVIVFKILTVNALQVESKGGLMPLSYTDESGTVRTSRNGTIKLVIE